MTRVTRTLIVCCLFLSLAACAGDEAAKGKRAQALKDLGGATVERGNLRGGLTKLLEADKLEPGDPDLNLRIALVYRNLGKYQLSREYFERALALRPHFPEAWNNLGTLCLLEKKWDQAIGLFKKAADDLTYQTPQFAYSNMGLAYINKGDPQTAVFNYERAIKFDPSYSPAYFNLGIAYEALGQDKEAIDAYRSAIQYYPKYAIAHLNLAKLFIRLGKKGKAKEQLNLTIWADPKGTEANEARKLLEK
jgi:type IV pilus assembly protein PilF